MNEHDQVIKFINNSFQAKYKILSNLGVQKNYHIGGLFPDIIILSKDDNSILFILEVETAESISTSATQWKNYTNLPGTLYIIVPEQGLAQAKSIAAVMGVKARFGYYKFNNGAITSVVYE